ncbi:MAG TPA: hypothetical protein VIV34_10375 [Pseudolabrys sp.]
MLLDFQSGSSEESLGFQEVGQQTARYERLITVLATSLGVTIVAAIAVLMGMA